MLSELILRGGQMHLVSYIGLIRLINQSLPHPPIRAIFMKWVTEDHESISGH